MEDIEESVKLERPFQMYMLQLDFCLIFVKIMTKSHKFGKIILEVIADNRD